MSTTVISDIIPNKSWIEKILPAALLPYSRLARYDRPIGVWLLLFPGLWSLALASNGQPPLLYLILFTVGAFAMRGAGCTYNDLVDHPLDAQVERTSIRPLPAGQVSRRQAMMFLGLQLSVGAFVLFQLPQNVILLGLGSLFLVVAYPWMKRITYWPQAWLGITFNYGALMGWMCVADSLTLTPFLLYGAGFFWTLGYDTIYAYQDIEDDLLTGIRSTAILFSRHTKLFLSVTYGVCLAFLTFVGLNAEVHPAYFAMIIIAGGHFTWQVWTLRTNKALNCLKRFRSSQWVALVIFIGCLLRQF